ncbi:MAG: TolC family protein [Leptospirillia bacterium]
MNTLYNCRLSLRSLGPLLLVLTLCATPASAQDDFVDLFSRAEAFHESIGTAREQARQAALERRKVLGQLLPSLDVSWSTTRREEEKTRTIGGSTSVIRPDQTDRATVQVGQTLYTGGRASNQLKIATIAQVAGEVELRAARETLLFDVAEAYFGILKAREDLATVSDRLTGMQRHLDAAKARVRLGADVRASVLRIESEVAQLAAERLQAEDQLTSAHEALATLTGGSPGVEPGTPPNLDAIQVVTIGDPVLYALGHRADMLVLAGEVLAADMGVRYTTGTFLPLVELEGNYTFEDTTSDFVPEEDASATLTASWNLYSGGEHLAERRRARSVRMEKRMDLARTQREIRIEVEQAVRGVKVAERIVEALSDGMTYALENHRIVSETYKAGAATYLDVIDASDTLGDARRELAHARFDYSLALLGLGRASGSLLTVVGEQPETYPELTRWMDDSPP